MDKPKTSAKDFFLWVGAMVALYWSIIAYINLVFNYINYALPDPLRSYVSDPYQSGISFEMASIIVLLPVAFILIRLIQKAAAVDPSRNEIAIRRWALIFTLFVSGVAMAGDLIYLLNTFLSGQDLTTTFLLKTILIFLIAAAVFMHFIADLKGYWLAFPQRRKAVQVAVGVLALVTIALGFVIVGTPQQARLYRLDDQKIQDLQSIQSSVVNYWQTKRELPATLASLTNSLSFADIPQDTQYQTAYEYRATGSTSFVLCATFNQKSRVGQPSVAYPAYGVTSTNWQHESGHVCFDRTIDPAFYPPLTK